MKFTNCIVFVALAIAAANAATNCPDGCPDVERPVCGSDGVTYSNKCELNIASCEKDGNVTQVSEGQCPRATLPPSNCDFLCTQEYDPVSDEEGNTYSNQCEMELAKCEKKDAATEAPTRRPRETLPPSDEDKCDFLCTQEYDPVGDEEGNTYPNQCEMELAQCRKRAGLTDCHVGDVDLSSWSKK